MPLCRRRPTAPSDANGAMAAAASARVCPGPVGHLTSAAAVVGARPVRRPHARRGWGGRPSADHALSGGLDARHDCCFGIGAAELRMTRHDQCSGTRGEDAWGRGWGCGVRGRPRGRAAWRRGDNCAALRSGGGGARSGVTPCPFGACPSGFASAPAIAAYKGKPIDWSRMVQEMGSRRFIGWLTRHDQGRI